MLARESTSTVDSGITPWPTSTGVAVLSAVIFAAVRSSVTSVALGPFVALLLIGIVDYVFAMRVLQQRPISVHAIRRVAASPDPVRLTVAAPTGSGPLRVHVRRLVVNDDDSDFVTLDRDDTSAEIEMPGDTNTTVGHLRFRADATVFGLVWARRWTVQASPDLHRGPGPVAKVDLDVRGMDELSRLRAYVPGDRMAHVSWGATARTGQLHVRSSMIDEDEVTIIVDCGPDVSATMDGRPQLDAVGELAASVGAEFLRAGRSVNLIVRESDPTRAELHRNDALAHPRRRGHADLEPDRWWAKPTVATSPTTVRSGRVFDEDELVARLTRLAHGPVVERPAAPYVEVCHSGIQAVS